MTTLKLQEISSGTAERDHVTIEHWLDNRVLLGTFLYPSMVFYQNRERRLSLHKGLPVLFDLINRLHLAPVVADVLHARRMHDSMDPCDNESARQLHISEIRDRCNFIIDFVSDDYPRNAISGKGMALLRSGLCVLLGGIYRSQFHGNMYGAVTAASTFFQQYVQGTQRHRRSEQFWEMGDWDLTKISVTPAYICSVGEHVSPEVATAISAVAGDVADTVTLLLRQRMARIVFYHTYMGSEDQIEAEMNSTRKNSIIHDSITVLCRRCAPFVEWLEANGGIRSLVPEASLDSILDRVPTRKAAESA